LPLSFHYLHVVRDHISEIKADAILSLIGSEAQDSRIFNDNQIADANHFEHVGSNEHRPIDYPARPMKTLWGNGAGLGTKMERYAVCK
jgi:hypothetical protein